MLIVLAHPAATRAQPSSAAAATLFNEANVHYNLGQLDLAVAKYLAAIRADPDMPGPYRNLGLTYRAQGKCQLAITYFKRYLSLRPTGRLSDRVQQEIATCEKQVGSAANIPTGAANVFLTVSEGGAEVKIDNVTRGSTPTPPLPVQPGTHTVTVNKRGFLSWNGTVAVSTGQVAELTIKLTRDPNFQEATVVTDATKFGVLRVAGVTLRVNVVVDGKETYLDDSSEARVPVGSHMVEIAKDGLVPWRRQVEIKENQTVSLTPELVATAKTHVLRRWGWIAMGTAGALAVTGLVLGLLENRSYQQIQQYDHKTGSRADLQGLMDTQHTEATLANVMYGLSASALATGIVLFVITPEVSEGHGKHGGLRAMIGGRFTFK